MLYLIILNAKQAHFYDTLPSEFFFFLSQYVTIINIFFSSSISFRIYDPKILTLMTHSDDDDVSYDCIYEMSMCMKERSKERVEYQIEN